MSGYKAPKAPAFESLSQRIIAMNPLIRIINRRGTPFQFVFDHVRTE